MPSVPVQQVVLADGRWGTCGVLSAIIVIRLLRGAEVPGASHVLTLVNAIVHGKRKGEMMMEHSNDSHCPCYSPSFVCMGFPCHFL